MVTGICENVAEVFEDFKYFRPTVVGGVPRWEFVVMLPKI
jgi:long-subunit acyl-CoA synthetase (AMP-forming)